MPELIGLLSFEIDHQYLKRGTIEFVVVIFNYNKQICFSVLIVFKYTYTTAERIYEWNQLIYLMWMHLIEQTLLRNFKNVLFQINFVSGNPREDVSEKY